MSPSDAASLANAWSEAADEDFLDAGLVTTPNAHPVEEGLVDIWAPPTGSTAADWDREVGCPADRVLLRAGESANGFERAVLRARVSELPQALRAVVRRVQRPFLALQLLDWIESHLNGLAHKEAAFVNAPSLNTPGSRWYIPAIHRRRYLQALAVDAAFVEEAQTRARDAVNLAHVTAVFSQYPRPLPKGLAPLAPPSRGPWSCESWLGLAQRPLAEDLPEGALVGAAQYLWERLQGLKRPANVLHWGALASGLTSALMATRPRSAKPLLVHEVETIGQVQDLPWVRWRSQELPPRSQGFEAIVCHLPPPGDGANQWRNRYKDLGAFGDTERRRSDMGRLGQKKWLEARRRLLVELAQRLGPAAELVVVHPLAVRTVQIDHGARPLWAYKSAPELAGGLFDELERLNLEVLRDVCIEEVNPVHVAPFGTAKCPWRCVIAGHSGTFGATSPLVDAAIHEVFGDG